MALKVIHKKIHTEATHIRKPHCLENILKWAKLELIMACFRLFFFQPGLITEAEQFYSGKACMPVKVWQLLKSHSECSWSKGGGRILCGLSLILTKMTDIWAMYLISSHSLTHSWGDMMLLGHTSTENFKQVCIRCSLHQAVTIR